MCENITECPSCGEEIFEGDNIIRCSFCGKTKHEVENIVAGPTACICNECVDLCNDVIQQLHQYGKG